MSQAYHVEFQVACIQYGHLLSGVNNYANLSNMPEVQQACILADIAISAYIVDVIDMVVKAVKSECLPT